MTPDRKPGRHGTRPTGPIVLRPVVGLPRFRKNVSLRLEGDAISATDRRGRTRSFALDGTDRAPAEIRVFRAEDEGLIDGAGKLLAIWENAIWNSKDEMALVAAAGIFWGTQELPDPPQMRSDGIRMFDIPALTMMRAFSGIGAVGFAGTQFHFMPGPVADIILATGFVGSVVSFVLWKRASRLDPEVAEHRRQAMQEALAEAERDDEDV